MEKRIIAALCVVILLSTAFVACGKKPTITLREGYEYELATDEEGNTMANEDGDLLVYVTNANGEYETYANGERQVNSVTFPNEIVGKDFVETVDYKFSMPKGWKLNENGKFYKNKTDEKCYVEIVLAKTLDETNGESIDTHFNIVMTQNEELIAQLNANGQDAIMIQNDFELSNGQTAKCLEYTIKNADGAVIHYANSVYFAVDDKVYLASYLCLDGVGYDEAFSFQNALTEGLAVK